MGELRFLLFPLHCGSSLAWVSVKTSDVGKEESNIQLCCYKLILFYCYPRSLPHRTTRTNSFKKWEQKEDVVTCSKLSKHGAVTYLPGARPRAGSWQGSLVGSLSFGCSVWWEAGTINYVLNRSRQELRKRINSYWREASQSRWYWNWALDFSKSRIKTKPSEGHEQGLL